MAERDEPHLLTAIVVVIGLCFIALVAYDAVRYIHDAGKSPTEAQRGEGE